MEVKKTYKRGIFGEIERSFAERGLKKKGYIVYSESDVKRYSAGKGIVLGLIFLPLALFGGARYIEVTYRLESSL